MPLRVPPPKAETVLDQWVIDALLHLDECIDEGKQANKEAFARLNDAQMELRAEVTASIAARQAADTNLADRLDIHEREHTAMDVVHKAQRSVWRMQYGWAREVAKGGVEVIKFGGVVWALKLAGVL